MNTGIPFAEWKTLSSEEIQKLLQITFAFESVLRHDSRSAIGAIANGTTIVDDCLRVIKDPNSTHQAIIEATQSIEAVNSSNERAISAFGAVFDACTNHVTKLKNYDLFCASPTEIANQVTKIFPDRNISTSFSKEIQDLRLIYPSSALFALIFELTSNATRHTDNTAKIELHWSFDDGKFRCHVEDGGPGITGLTHKNLPLWQIHKSRTQEKHDEDLRGLRIVQSLVDFSEGLLLFKKSDTLGGTDAYFEISVLGFLRDGKLVRLRQFNEH